MDCTATVVGPTYQEPGVDEGRSCFPLGKSIRDGALVEQLRREDAGAVGGPS